MSETYDGAREDARVTLRSDGGCERAGCVYETTDRCRVVETEDGTTVYFDRVTGRGLGAADGWELAA
jgi:hypothetical protein